MATPSITSLPPDNTDLGPVINKAECYCLNEHPSFPHQNLFIGDARLVLRSDTDAQLLLHISFRSTVKIHSIAFRAPEDETAPSVVKVYSNRQNMGFSDVEDLEPVQTLELTPDDFVSDNSTPLKFVRFQRVSSLTLFVEENQGGEFTTLSSVRIFGTSIDSMDVSDIHKRRDEA